MVGYRWTDGHLGPEVSTQRPPRLQGPAFFTLLKVSLMLIGLCLALGRCSYGEWVGVGGGGQERKGKGEELHEFLTGQGMSTTWSRGRQKHGVRARSRQPAMSCVPEQ